MARRETALPPKLEEELRRLTQYPWLPMTGAPLSGRTAFVVGAGPSLRRNAHLLRHVPEGSAIICLSTAAELLGDLGITADLVWCAPEFFYKPSLRHHNWRWIAMPSRPKRLSVQRLSELMRGLPGAMYYRIKRLPSSIDGHFPLFSGYDGTTAGLMIGTHVAIRYGAVRIVLVGVDLGLECDGGYYTTGVTKRRPKADYITGMVTAWGGEGIVLVTRAFANQHDYVAREIAGTPGVECINATEGGRRIVGASEMTLADAIADTPPADPVVIEPQRLTPRVA